jgi:hypothetical protein
MPLPSFRSQFRRAAALALTASAMFGTQIAAFAQDGPPDEGDDTIEIVGWDLSDPVNRAESREFFAGLWAAQDAGLPPPEFEFTNLPPDLLLAMLLPELEVFTEIYRHRLQLDFDAGERYLVTDLIAEDAEVRSEFRAFVLTGKLAPRPEIDAEAYLAHFELVIDAMTVQQRASIERVEALGVLVESQGMSVEMAEPTRDDEVGPPTPPWIPADEIERRHCALRWLISWSGLKCIYKARFRNETSRKRPDLDCDDYADAMLRFMLRKLEGWRGKIGTIYWTCPDGSDGHGVPILVDPDGGWWWIEPEDGSLHGPFRDEVDVLRSARAEHEAASRCGGGELDKVLDLETYRQHLPETPPWHTSDAMRRRFCRALRSCCNRFANVVYPWVPPAFMPTGERLYCDALLYIPSAPEGGIVVALPYGCESIEAR